MMDEYFAVPISPTNKRARAQMDALLEREGIERDRNLTYSAAIYDDDGQMIATGSLFENTLRCLAVDGAHRGEGLMAVIVAHLVQAQLERGNTHLFLYTKIDSAKFFAPLGFTEIARVDGRLVFMENRRDGFARYLKSLAPYAGERPGAALVMNANPFTNGHRYLIQQAAAQCDWLHLFLVKEDSSRFPYEDRLDLVLKGTADIPRLTVHRGSEYIISRATFPCYFIKEQSVINHCYTEIDLKIFRQYLAPALGVTHRFVGTEPFCRVTAQYNQDMRYWLETPTISAPPIELVEIERLRYQEMPISASRVRQLLAKNDLTAIAPLVPAVTLHYLQNLLEHSRQDAAARQKTPA